MQPTPNRGIVVIGGSAGASAPLKSLLAALPEDLNAAIFIALHVSVRSFGILSTVVSATGQWPVHQAEDGMPTEPGHIYLAVPDHHLILAPGHIRLGRGPRENMARPSIDPLFRSAALAYGPRVIGVLLSGLLNDGASGLEAIKRCGGVAVVQDPQDALASEMPLSALRATSVDVTVPAAAMGDVLIDLVREPAGWPVPAPADIQLEVDIAAGERVDSEIMRRFGDPSAITCPSCGGVMTRVRGSRPLRFRCQVGHSMTADVMAKQQENSIDEALRVALRIIEERAELVAKMAEDGMASGWSALAQTYSERAMEYRRYADTLRQAVLWSMQPTPASPDGVETENEEGAPPSSADPGG